jgi:Uma2 family endonuclease
MLYVSPRGEFVDSVLENWLFWNLTQYEDAHPEIINFVTPKARVFVHARKKATVPQPDMTAYHDLPLDSDFRDIHWRDLNPVLVAEILVDGDAHKDLTRNPDLYFDVPSIREYWVLDGRDKPEELTLIQHRRYGKRWVVRSYTYRSTFTTKMLPGFILLIGPRS